MQHVIRLTKGQDLKKEIRNYCEKHLIKAGYVESSVGCLYELNLRLAGGIDYLYKKEDFEIICVNGTCSMNGIHLHMSVSDCLGNMLGGHMEEGCLINTTCELIINELDDYIFTREFDENTGYHELLVKKVAI